ncbi:nuclear transport factor 2 family protein [Amycolatopsis sp. WQ 127309]|uniref:nuclear transport factor 2 family protein n=1 Tax=Amycolatopsis sp. WQ 127309 TaxID=2932773 RepID=UPI001FF2B726|nr:nuclear transport factor 2 family protein [Amycolatopsis sp. WQ 127309]UOZ04880.1 nuclear transport factor 2 family protein [Amycolatopsis sp. WQ 127309]
MSTSEDVTRIEQVILHERQGRDRGRWAQMRAAFAPDSRVNLSWYTGDGPGFVTGSERMSAQGDYAVHRLSPPVVHTRGDRAIAEVSCGVEFQIRIGDVPAHLVSYTRLNYRLTKSDGRWQVREMDAIYERDTLTPAFPGDTVNVTSSDTAGFRTSYALLTYYLRSKGYSIGDDLLGDDRPERVQAFYDETLEWLDAAQDTSQPG